MIVSTPALNVLLHTLGYGRSDTPYRNYFVASEDHHEIRELRELEAAGLMFCGHRPGFLTKGDLVFHATTAGKQVAAEEHLRRKPRLTRSQKRYRRFLSCRDVDPDMTFRRFLDLDRDLET